MFLCINVIEQQQQKKVQYVGKKYSAEPSPPLRHCRSVLLNRAIKKFVPISLSHKAFALLGLNDILFLMPKHPLPQGGKNLFGQLVLKKYQVLGEE